MPHAALSPTIRPLYTAYTLHTNMTYLTPLSKHCLHTATPIPSIICHPPYALPHLPFLMYPLPLEGAEERGGTLVVREGYARGGRGREGESHLERE
jgi:hypothetical protein